MLISPYQSQNSARSLDCTVWKPALRNVTLLFCTFAKHNNAYIHLRQLNGIKVRPFMPIRYEKCSSTPTILYSYTVTHFSKLQCSSSNISRNLNFIRSRILTIFGRQVKGMAAFQNFKFKKTIKQSKKLLLIAKCISDVYWLMWN